MSIYRLIPEDRWVTRAELVERSGLCDRSVRSEINELRKNPETVIVSSSQGKGYKRPKDEEELKTCIAEYKSRIDEQKKTVEVMERALRIFQARRYNQQPELF